ncbi:MAG: hypothetical protein ACI358_02625 [Candidatus Limimorpha sp.]
MKKLLLTLSIIASIGLSTEAQTDLFFNDYKDSRSLENGLIETPQFFGCDYDFNGMNGSPNAPVGSGLLILTTLGIGYSVARKKEDK